MSTPPSREQAAAGFAAIQYIEEQGVALKVIEGNIPLAS
jgi:hypothetical protein